MKKRKLRLLFSAILLAFALLFRRFFPDGPLFWAAYILFAAAYLAVGLPVLQKAARNLAHGTIFDENFLMTLATIGALILGEYPEAVAVMLFYQLGELFEQYAVGRSRRSISALMSIRPDHATRLLPDGTTETVDPASVAVGETILVTAGERIPLDGVVTAGESSLDTSALTGESMPREVRCGDEAQSGCINRTGLLHLRTTKEYGESTVAKILELVENASSKKSKSEKFITRFAAVYTPVVVIGAVLLAIVPPLFLGRGDGAVWRDWVYRALNFLVVSCPCALVISVPLSFFGGIGGASRKGILVKGSNDLEAMAHVEIAVFDKTGTLTKGIFEVTSIQPDGPASPEYDRKTASPLPLVHKEPEERLLAVAAAAERYSNHPISQSLRRAYEAISDRFTPEDRAALNKVENAEEVAGYGVRALVCGHSVTCGKRSLMPGSAEDTEATEVGTTVTVAVDGQSWGCVTVSDTEKPDAKDAIRRLKESGVRKTVMLTGDAKGPAERIAESLGLDEVHAKLLPADKVAAVEALLQEKSEKGKLLFVGDGINDAPVLARADVGAAMGGMGQDAAIEAADLVIMTDEPSKLADAVTIAKKTLRIVRENIVFALTVKVLVLLLAAFNLVGLWAAVFADVGVSVIAILNAMRAE